MKKNRARRLPPPLPSGFLGALAALLAFLAGDADQLPDLGAP
jgi:hypothetical protein